MPVPLTDLTRQHAALEPELRAAFEEVSASGQLILGPHVRAFEQVLARSCGVEHAVGVSSGNDAILLALLALGIGAGDEVITTSLAYLHLAESIARVGATPVFADIHPRTFNLDPETLPGKITDKTRAILPTHIFGLPADLDPIRKVATAHDLKVIEDCDMAIGAGYRGRTVGAIGDVATLSFYPTKNLAALGDAGAVLTNDAGLADRLRRGRVHGLEKNFVVRDLGGAFRLDGLQAAFLSVKLPHLEAWTARRRELAARYDKLLGPLPLTTPFESDDYAPVYNQYVVRVRSGGREPLRLHLEALGVGTRVYYPRPLHLQPCFEPLGYHVGSLPVAEKASAELLALPMFPEMTREEQDEVVDAVRDFFLGD